MLYTRCVYTKVGKNDTDLRWPKKVQMVSIAFWGLEPVWAYASICLGPPPLGEGDRG